MPVPTIQNKLSAIGKVISINKVLDRDSAKTSEIANYYKKNRFAYKLFNSKDDFVHMGISEGENFSENDFLVQGDLVSLAASEIGARNILELAPGKAATTRYLARKHPNLEFFCIDLPDGQFKAEFKESNVHPSYGDYHDLSDYADSSMDIVYVIEALCHAAVSNKCSTRRTVCLGRADNL